MNITAYNLDTVKATDVLAFMQSGDMGFVTEKDYILYAGSIDGKSITTILKNNNSFGHMNVAHTTLGSMVSDITKNKNGVGQKFLQSVTNDYFGSSVSFGELTSADKILVMNAVQ